MDKQKRFDEILRKKGILQSVKRQKVSLEGRHLLSFSQQRIYFLQQFQPDSTAYNDITTLHLEGDLNLELLEIAFSTIIQRQTILQMHFLLVDGRPVQVFENRKNFHIPVVHIEPSDNLDSQKIAERYVNDHFNKPFDLAKDHLIDVVLLKLAADDFILLIKIHHIIFDGWSKGLLLKELKLIYESYLNKEIDVSNKLPEEPEYQYLDYVYWQRDWIQQENYQKQLNYWENKLKDSPPVLDLAMGRTRPSIQSGKGSFQMLEIPDTLFQAIVILAKNKTVSLYMLLLAVFKILLLRYTGETDITVGSPVAARKETIFENMIGLFVNTIVLRTDLKNDPSFSEVLKQVEKEVVEAFDNQDLPFEKLIERLNPQRNLSYSPLFQVMFTLQNIYMPSMKMADLRVTPLTIDYGFSQADLSLTVWEEADLLRCSFEYNTDIFTAKMIERLKGHYRNLLEQICWNPEKRLSQYQILSEGEKDILINHWNNTEADDLTDTSIVSLFERQAEITPDSTAVYHNERRISYRELDEKANQVGRLLCKNRVRPEMPVGICTTNSIEFLVGVLGVLKAGGCFIPIDPEYPVERIMMMVDDSQLDVLLTVTICGHKFAGYGGRIIFLDSDWELINEESCSQINDLYSDNNLSCVIYTSGTTGKPKGVMLENRSIVNLLYSFIESYNPGEDDRILPLSSIASASFVGEILPLLIVGGAVILIDRTDFLDIQKIARTITQTKVTILSTVPSMVSRLNVYLDEFQPIRLILSGGETLYYHNFNQLSDKVSIVNGYGLTETSICSTYYLLDELNIHDDLAVPVGKPIRNTRIYILDKYLNLLPIGCAGEMYIAGAGVSRGYLHDPDLTRERYLEDPFVGGERMFRTKDYGLWTEDGNLRFIKRVDRQVQIHGFRVELEEIEKHLSSHPEIQDVAVIGYELSQNDSRVVAYYVTKSGEVIASGQLREWLFNKLPEQMIPSFFEWVEVLPMNFNGKVDVKQLPRPKMERPTLDVEYETPSTDTEKKIASVWEKNLSIKKVGIKDNFFDIGGHSLLLMQVCNDLKILFDKDISIVDMFKYPTIHSLANYLTEDDQEQNSTVNNQIINRAHKQREILFGRKIKS